MLKLAKRFLSFLLGSSERSAGHKVKIDLVTEHPETGVFAIILVETGPWTPGSEERELSRIQERLYNCVDVAVDGHLAAKYPDSRGRPVRIQLDTYDIPDSLVRPFFERFANHVATWAEIQQEILAKQNVKSLTFEYNPRTIDGYTSR
jgi:hypothetical protein